MSKSIRFTNDFHNTEAFARPRMDKRGRLILSGRQVARLRKKLCGIATCTCGGCCGERGPNNPDHEPLDYDRYGLRVQLEPYQRGR